MLRAFKIPPLALLATVMFLAIGELICGTSIYFVTMMVVTMLSIGVTYNFLGGLSTLSGIIFAAFAARTIVISQFAKVILLEAADKNLEVPGLTISVYAVFYISAMLGAFLFGRARLALPKPLNPTSVSQSRVLYGIALACGLIGSVLFEFYTTAYSIEDNTYNSNRSIGVALSPLLLFAVVLAVDLRIKKTNGRHSAGIAFWIPWGVATFWGFVDTVRTAMLTPTLIYFLSCYFRGYRFRSRHFAAAVVCVLTFGLFLSPLELYMRDFVRGRSLRDRIDVVLGQADFVLHNPNILQASVAATAANGGASREQYFSMPGTYLISRFSLIRADSDVIHACSNGYRYGLTPSLIDLEISIPSFLLKNKPRDTSGQDYIGRVSGMSGDATGVTYPQVSAVSDSYGAFGWLGVILFPLLCFPAVFVIFESMFDMSSPWGTVAFGLCFLSFGEMMVGRFIPLVVRDPLLLLTLSFALGSIARSIPVRADRSTVPMVRVPAINPRSE